MCEYVQFLVRSHNACVHVVGWSVLSMSMHFYMIILITSIVNRSFVPLLMSNENIVDVTFRSCNVEKNIQLVVKVARGALSIQYSLTFVKCHVVVFLVVSTIKTLARLG